MRVIDLTGQHFTRLEVIERIENGKSGCARWRCKCVCGNYVIATTNQLRRGAVKSCGCYSHDLTKQRNKDNARHGVSRTRLYREWSQMKARCYIESHKSFADYGGRGIKVCDEWLVSDNFFSWALSHGYSDELTIDRIDTNGDYEPSNCRFVTPKEQIRNRRNTVTVEYQGQLITLAELSELSGVPYATMHFRYRQGKTVEEMMKPVRKYKKG